MKHFMSGGSIRPWLVTAAMTLVVVSAAHAATPGTANRATPEVTIKRDGYGVPHIYAGSVYGVYYGYGYAIAQDRLFQMELAKRSTQGTVAEVLGPKWVDFDKSIRANYWPASIERQLAVMPRRELDILEGYAAGMNAWIAQVQAHPGQYLSKQFSDYGFGPSQWSAFDVAMVFVGTMANRFSDVTSKLDNLALLTALKDRYGTERGMALFDQLKWTVNPDALTTVPPEDGVYPIKTTASSALTAQTLARYDGPAPMLSRLARGDDGALLHASPQDNATTLLAQFEQSGANGLAGYPTTSNMWIIGRDKARGAKAIMLNGPQFGWFAPAYTYGVGLHGAGFDIVGNTPFGYPCILFGHNGQVAWGSTAGFGNDVDVFAEKVDPQHPDRYFHNGSWQDMDKRIELIRVKGADPVVMPVERTVHGIVIQRDNKQHVAYAKARAWDGLELQSLLAWTHQGQAKDWKSWSAEAARHALTINWYYADRDGNIGYVHTGKYPDRRPDQDVRLPTPGTGEWDWRGLLPFSTNPKVYNPKQGWIANWNNSPQRGYPASDLFAFLWGEADRVVEIQDRIRSHNTLGVDDVWQILKDTSVVDVNRRHFVPFITRAVADLPVTDNRRRLAQLLIDWDGLNHDPQHSGHYDTAGPVVMEAWLTAMLRRTLGQVVPAPYDKWFLASGYAAPQDGPTGSVNISNGSKILYEALKGPSAGVPQTFDIFLGRSQQGVILGALEEAYQALLAKMGPDMAQWHAPTVPLTFRSNNFFGVPQAGATEAVRTPVYMNRGTENDLIVFGDPQAHGKAQAWDVVAPGQSGFIAPNGQPSEHYADQLSLYTEFGRKPLAHDAAYVQRTTRSVEHLRITKGE